MRSVFIPLERVDRFDVVLEQAEVPGLEFQRLVLMTREGKTISFQTKVTQWLRSWRGRPPAARAQQLNNLIAEKRREARPSDGGRLQRGST